MPSRGARQSLASWRRKMAPNPCRPIGIGGPIRTGGTGIRFPCVCTRLICYILQEKQEAQQAKVRSLFRGTKMDALILCFCRNTSKVRDVSCENSQHPVPNDEGRKSNQGGGYESRDKGVFKVPETKGRRRRSRDRRDRSFDRRNKSKPSRESSFERNRRSSTSEHENWREEIIRSRQNSEREGSKEPLDVKKGGILILPSQKPEVRKMCRWQMAQRL